jgi:DNA sulfur modification protein DndB
MGNLADEFTGKLIRDKEIRSHLKIRSNEFVFETVDKRLQSDYDSVDWSLHKTNKKSVVLKKRKPLHVMFEDRVWTILAKMGFLMLNNKELRLPYVDDESIPGKQIDTFAADNEAIIVVECKSAETMKKQHFSKELNEYDKVISGGNKILRKVFSDKHKIRYIFATNNINLSDNDRNRLKELQMFHFNQDDITYYEQLLNTVGSVAKYQLLARLFNGIDIPAFENKIPAIRGKMGGYNYYSFSMEPEKLLKISYILHRVNVNNDDRGYQRLVRRSRLKEIENFIDCGGFFPNSIIVNINTKQDAPLNFDKINSPLHNSKITEPVILHLPKRYHSAFIIDGQHRLYGYARSKYRQNNAIPVVAFENLPAEEQIKLFVQINSKQKPVSKNLLTTISAELMWNSEKYDEALTAFMSKLLADLGEKDNSPLYGRIILGDRTRTVNTCVTLDTVIVYGLKKSMYFAKLNKKKLVDIGHLWRDPKTEDGSFDYSLMLEKSYLFFSTYFDHVKEKTERIWNLGNATGGFVAMNIGIICFIRIGSDILDYIKKYECEDYSMKNGKEIAELTFRYLEPVFEYINYFDTQKIDQFRKYGTNPSGVENGIREFQREICNRFTNFAPDGLQKWIIDNSGKFNDIVKTAAEKFEIGIKAKVYAALMEKFGATWWKDGVPPDIRKDAVTTKIDEDSEEPDSEFLHLIDYKKIISRNWDIFKPIFADPGIKSNKDEQMKWFDKLNPIRNRQAHYRKITSEQYEFIKHLNNWLPEKLGISKIDISV